MNFSFLSFEFLDLIYKRKCVNCACAIQEGILCKKCAKLVQNLPPFTQGKINGFELFCAHWYEGVIKEIIHKLKFNHHKACALFLAQYLFNYFIEVRENNKDINFENPIIIPVPTHKKNRYKRGYDNVVEICKEFSALTGFELNTKVLTKIKYTAPQFTMTIKQRTNNPKNSFALNNFYTEKLVILVDDICTTGSTLEFITSMFKERGIKNLICLTVAKTKVNKK